MVRLLRRRGECNTGQVQGKSGLGALRARSDRSRTTITPDDRTRSLIVKTTRKEDLKTIQDVLEALDVPSPDEG
jgi:type II secretory pathway component GspD/PulD (secretin)